MVKVDSKIIICYLESKSVKLTVVRTITEKTREISNEIVFYVKFIAKRGFKRKLFQICVKLKFTKAAYLLIFKGQNRTKNCPTLSAILLLDYLISGETCISREKERRNLPEIDLSCEF